MRLHKSIPVFAMLLALLINGCNQEPVDIYYGSDQCTHCKMMISEQQFASQLVTKKGKVHKFDSIECLASYHQENKDDLTAPMLWVSNYEEPSQWLNAKNAHFVKSEEINSPMGESLLALPSLKTSKKHVAQKPGKIIKWEEVAYVIQ